MTLVWLLGSGCSRCNGAGDSTRHLSLPRGSGGPQTRRVDPENGPAARRPDRIGRHGERAERADLRQLKAGSYASRCRIDPDERAGVGADPDGVQTKRQANRPPREPDRGQHSPGARVDLQQLVRVADPQRPSPAAIRSVVLRAYPSFTVDTVWRAGSIRHIELGRLPATQTEFPATAAVYGLPLIPIFAVTRLVARSTLVTRPLLLGRSVSQQGLQSAPSPTTNEPMFSTGSLSVTLPVRESIRQTVPSS